MPRLPRTYTKTIVKAPKKKWNRLHLYSGPSSESIISNTVWYQNVVVNKVDTPVNEYSASPSVLQACKIKAQFQVTLHSNAEAMGPARGIATKAYIVYLPQICVSELDTKTQGAETYEFFRTLVFNNPEYVMGSKLVNNRYQGGIPGEQCSFSFSVNSGKLKRNLKSGDRIFVVFEIKNINTATPADFNMFLYTEMEASVTQL